MMTITTTGFDSSLLYSVNSFSSSSSSSSSLNFKFRATRKLHLFKSGGKLIKASSSFSSSSSSSTNKFEEVSDQNGCLDMYRRRALVSLASLACIVPVFESTERASRVNAAEVVEDKSVFIRDEVRKVLSKGKAPGVLRLVFHDAGTFDTNDKSGGMNGSIIYELDRPENAGLKKSVKILEKVRSEFDGTEPVSWADMIAVAGAEAVTICGGPTIPVRLGRLDSVVPDPEGKLPEESLDVSALKQCFLREGFSTQELVALSGAHTIGGKGFGSPTTFDNAYYKILLEKPWISSASTPSMIGLPSDHVLAEDEECLRWIVKYADDQNSFFEDFRNAYIKLVNSGAVWKKA